MRTPVRLSAGAAGVVAVLALAGFGVHALAAGDDGAPRPTVATDAPMDSASTCTCDSTVVPAARPSGSPSSGFLGSKGSHASGAQAGATSSVVTLRSVKPLTALTVELRLDELAGVEPAGWSSSLPRKEFAVTVTRASGQLVYRWVLRPGAEVPAGRLVFTARYARADGGRAASGDVYVATAAARGGSARVAGGF